MGFFFKFLQIRDIFLIFLCDYVTLALDNLNTLRNVYERDISVLP